MDAQSLAQLAETMLSPSRDCNAQGAAFYRQTIYSLANKTELERVIQESMKDLAPEGRAEKASIVAPPLQSEPLPVTPSTDLADERVKSLCAQTKKEYQPALQDRSLVEALLALHRNSSRPPARLAPPTPAPQTSSSSAAAQAPPAFQGFSAIRAPEVEASPKTGRYMSRTPGVSRSILRPNDT